MISSGPVEDRLAIRELVESYNDAVMRFDGDAWKENWREDAIWSLPGAGEIAGRDNFFPIWQGAMSGFSFVGFFLLLFLLLFRVNDTSVGAREEARSASETRRFALCFNGASPFVKRRPNETTGKH